MHLNKPRFCSAIGLLIGGSLLLHVSYLSLNAQEPGEPRPAVLAHVHSASLDDLDRAAVNLAGHLGYQLPSPLVLLSASTGIQSGIDTAGAASIYLIAETEDPVDRPVLCVSLPVSDYARFVQSLGNTNSEGVAQVKIAGQPMSVVRSGTSALLVDRNHEALLKDLAETVDGANAHEGAVLQGEHVISVTIAPAGLQLLKSLTAQSADEESDEGEFEDDIFGLPADEPAIGDQVWQHENELWSNSLDRLSRFLEVRQASNFLQHLERGSVRFSIDEQGNVTLDSVLTWNKSVDVGRDKQPSKTFPHHEFGGGDFVTFGGGSLPKIAKKLLIIEAGVQIDELMLGTPLALYTDEKMQFLDTLKRAMEETQAVGILHRQANAKAGCFSDSYLVLDCEDAASLTAKVIEAFKSWNWLMDNTHGEVTLQFNSEPTTILGKKGIEYSADMLAATGFDPIPEIRKSMEELFGPGGMYRFQVIKLDDQRVLLANASKAQTKEFLVEFNTKKAPLIESGTAQPVLKIMPKDSNFILVFNPHAYTVWLERSATAGTEQIIGGPLVQLFPESHPVGLSGSFDERESELRLVAPADAVQAFGRYLRAMK